MSYTLKTKNSFLNESSISDYLEKTEEAIATNPSYQKELDLLYSSSPKTIPLSQIIIKLGATWIPLHYYELFALEILEVEIKLFYSSLINTWDVSVIKTKGMGTYDWGWEYDPFVDGDGRYFYRISDFPAIDIDKGKMNRGLFTMALTQTTPEVRIKLDRSSSTETDPYFTRQAIAKQKQIERKFEAWCRQDEKRALDLETIYNAKINQTVAVDWVDKGLHLRSGFEQIGLSVAWIKKLRNYQLDAIWRFTQTGGIVALEVGLGKTAIACCIAMLRKKYDNAKSMLVVQRSTLDQFHSSFLELFPDANLLCLQPQDFSASSKQMTLAKIAYFDWDAIILTHDSFGSIPLKLTTESSACELEIKQINDEINRLHFTQGTNNSSFLSSITNNKVVEALIKQRQSLQDLLAELLVQEDIDCHGLTWEDLGVSFLLVDEVQRYKNACVTSSLSRRIAGLSISPSGRAKDFDLKTSWLRQKYGDRSIVGMTGTPEPTNSLLGIYVFQTYFQPLKLKSIGMNCLDAWIANFGKVTSLPEPKVDGKWRITERLTNFINVAELAQLWFSCCHYKRYDDVKHDFAEDDLRPEPEYIKVFSPMSPYQKQQMQVISDRYQSLKAGCPQLFPQRDSDGCLLNVAGDRIYYREGDAKRSWGFPNEAIASRSDAKRSWGFPNEAIASRSDRCVYDLQDAIDEELNPKFITDNFLLLTSDSRKLCIAPQLIDPDVPVADDSKLANLAQRVLKVYNDTADQASTQVVFLDIGTPGGTAKFCLYDWLKAYWINQGVPKRQIAFIQNYSNPKKKEALFARFNRGEVRILLTSSESGGIGVNIQEKLIAIHHGDFALRPDILEQREGRGIRQGNSHNKIRIYTYVTEGSNGVHGADTVMLQFLQNKQQTRDRFFRSDPSLRKLNEGDDIAELYMLLKAESTGDERVIRYTEIEVELEEAIAELSLTQSELARIDGSKKGSLTAVKKQINSYHEQNTKFIAEIDTVSDYHTVAEPNDIFHFCFDDGALYIGHVDIVKNQPFLSKPDWLLRLRSLYGQYSDISSLILLPLEQAKARVAQRLKLEILATDFKVKTGQSYRSSQDSYEVGSYHGLRVNFVPYGDTSFAFWLQGQHQWRMVFRKTEGLLIEQLENAIAEVLKSRHRNTKLIESSQIRLDKLKDIRVTTEVRVRDLTNKVDRLDKEKNELQSVLNIEI